MEDDLFQGGIGSDMNSAPRLSIAIPIYNEESNVSPLLTSLGAVLDGIPGGPHEIVFVDDGSTDRSLALLEEAAAQDNRIVIISLSRNFGHQIAITAALDHVSGDVAIVMDADLQDDPEAIPEFLRLHEQGYDVVYAQRFRRKEPFWLKFSYYAFYRILSKIADTRLPVDAGDFALMSRRVVEEIKHAHEHHRYLRGLRTWAGFRQIGIQIERRERATGESKYSLGRLFGLAFDGIFAFSVVPLRLATLCGCLAIFLATLFSLYSLYAKLFLAQSPRGFTSLILMLTFVSGINLLFLGVMGEYVGRIYEEVKGRPLYIVQRVIRH